MPDHGGSLRTAATLFPGAPRPWIDCSTGINPHPYPVSDLPASAWQRLPEPAAAAELARLAARFYAAPCGANVVAAPGTQILLPLVYGLVPPGDAVVLGPTYAEHARAARLAGHGVREVDDPAWLSRASVAVVVNPNNPDGRLMSAEALLVLAAELKRRDGLLVVDEAFMEVSDPECSLCPHVETAGNVVVLRSFGKFFGLAGLRLGFAVAARALAARLDALLGPWAVSGPALLIGAEALADEAWQKRARARLAQDGARLGRLLNGVGLSHAGTDLYRFVRTGEAARLFIALGVHGVYARRFEAMGDALRLGLPADEAGWRRLGAALDGFRQDPQHVPRHVADG